MRILCLESAFFTKKCIFFAFFSLKICIYQKKVVILHRLLKMTPKQTELETQKFEKIMKTNNNEIANVIAGQFVTATRNFMEWNKKMNPFHSSQFRDQYCDAISELIPFCFSINNIEIRK